MENTNNSNEEKKVTLRDLQSVLERMQFYNRNFGFIAYDLSGKIAFFDSEPSFGGVYVTREDIIRYIKEF